MRLKTRTALIALAVLMSLLRVNELSAHHSMAMYDQQKTIIITGIVKRIDYKNPHPIFVITVTDDGGSQVDWTLETQSTAQLTSFGWTANTIKLGDKVSVAGNPARNGTPALHVSAIQLPDGRTIKT
jgi:hypothetical protein